MLEIHQFNSNAIKLIVFKRARQDFLAWYNGSSHVTNDEDATTMEAGKATDKAQVEKTKAPRAIADPNVLTKEEEAAIEVDPCFSLAWTCR
jgi:hypothetical protein